MKVYLDNGATTKLDDSVTKAILPYFNEKYGNASSLHSKGQEAKMALEESREIIAKKLKARPDEIIFTSGGTESDNLALKGVAQLHDSGHIITTKIEHPAITNTCKELEKQFEVTYLDVDKEGFISLHQLKNSIKPNTILISIMHANNEIGTIQPLKEIGEIAKEHKILFHSDAVQSFTKEDINTKKINIDLISISAHKIHGPKGIGALYVKNKTKLKKQILGGKHEYNLRAGTENVSSAVGFAKAVQVSNKKDIKHMKKLRDYFITNILKIKHTKLNGPKERLCNNINLSFAYIEGESIGALLDAKGICSSTGSACSSKELKASAVLEAIHLPPEYINGSLRLTMSKFTTKEELDYTLEELKKIVEKLRKLSPLGK
ncbi:cysteine desulfurase NifS [archaeon]|nr:cysteine desulfurase NifS [archaeon]